MAALEANMRNLASIGLLEKDNNGDVLQVWQYPEISEELSEVIRARSNLQEEKIPIQFSFSKHRAEWIYIHVHVNSNNARVPVFAIAVVATDFNPEKYAAETRLFASLYAKAGTPLKLLDCFLSLFTKGAFNPGPEYEPELAVNAADFDQRSSYLAVSLKDIVLTFGEESILIWNALVMKKRVAVVSNKLSALLQLTRALPLFVFHRGNWNILRPFVTLSGPELADLKQTPGYVAGFLDASAAEHEELFDVLIDVTNKTVSVATHAQGDFRMTTFHKDLCQFMVDAAESPDVSAIDYIKALTQKTKGLISKLESLKTTNEQTGEDFIDYEVLKNTKLPAGMDRFLYNVAAAEGLTKTS